MSQVTSDMRSNSQGLSLTDSVSMALFRAHHLSGLGGERRICQPVMRSDSAAGRQHSKDISLLHHPPGGSISAGAWIHDHLMVLAPCDIFTHMMGAGPPDGEFLLAAVVKRRTKTNQDSLCLVVTVAMIINTHP